MTRANTSAASALGLLLARIAVGGVFVLSGWAKASAPLDAFSKSILSYDLVPPLAAGLMAVYMPWLEMLAGACILIGLWGRGGAMVICLSLLAFTGAKLSVLLRGIPIRDCGCFGRALHWLELPGALGVVENLFFLALVLVLVTYDMGPWRADRIVTIVSRSQPATTT